MAKGVCYKEYLRTALNSINGSQLKKVYKSLFDLYSDDIDDVYALTQLDNCPAYIKKHAGIKSVVWLCEDDRWDRRGTNKHITVIKSNIDYLSKSEIRKLMKSLNRWLGHTDNGLVCRISCPQIRGMYRHNRKCKEKEIALLTYFKNKLQK